MNDKFEINDEVVDKKMESLTKTVKDFHTENSKQKSEIISVWQGVDNWKAGVNAIKGQLLNEVK